MLPKKLISQRFRKLLLATQSFRYNFKNSKNILEELTYAMHPSS